MSLHDIEYRCFIMFSKQLTLLFKTLKKFREIRGFDMKDVSQIDKAKHEASGDYDFSLPSPS